jgi:4-hydroxymandelate oxidase
MTEPDISTFVSIDQIVARATEVIDPSKFIWADAAAGQGVTATRNIRALNQLALVQKVLVDVGEVDTRTSFVGIPLDTPFITAPVGAISLYHPDGAMGPALAAAAAGTSSVCGMLVSEPWEDLAATAPGRHFFQMYVGGDRAWLSDVIQRVEAAGFGGIVVTADSPVIGRRDRALVDGFTWAASTHESDYNLSQHGYDVEFRKRVTWDDFEWICANTSLPVVLKGVLAVDDARRAEAAGARGIYVSNHAGRTLDQSVSTIEVLQEIVDAIDVDVIVDGGFSRGADACKALALGAKAVGLGRIQCWALAAGGTAGVAKLFEILHSEFDRSMANLGCSKIADLSPDRVRWSISTI